MALHGQRIKLRVCARYEARVYATRLEPTESVAAEPVSTDGTSERRFHAALSQVHRCVERRAAEKNSSRKAVEEGLSDAQHADRSDSWRQRQDYGRAQQHFLVVERNRGRGAPQPRLKL